MEIKAAKPVSNVSASSAAAGKPSASSGQEVKPPQAVAEPKQVVRDMQQTLAVVAQHLNELARSSSRNLEFSVDKGANTTVITVRNASTGEVVRQIPNEDALRLMRRLNAQSGTFVDLTA